MDAGTGLGSPEYGRVRCGGGFPACSGYSTRPAGGLDQRAETARLSR